MTDCTCTCMCSCANRQESNVRIIGAVPRRIKNEKAVREAFAPVREAIEELREAARKRLDENK